MAAVDASSRVASRLKSPPEKKEEVEVLSVSEKQHIAARLTKLRNIVCGKLEEARDLEDLLGPSPAHSEIITRIIEQKRISRPDAVSRFRKELKLRMKEIEEVSDEIIEASQKGGLEKLVAGEFPNLSEVWTGDAYDGLEELEALDEYIVQISSILLTEESIISEIVKN